MKSKYDVKPGDYIHINWMEGEPQYAGREGVVRSVDSIGGIHGSWGGLALLPEDNFEIIEMDKDN